MVLWRSVFCLFLISSAYSVKQHDDNHRVKENELDSTFQGGRIVGGYAASINDFPHQVYLLTQRGKNYYQCGGSLIKNNVVLTAAHCMVGVSNVFVRAGSSNSEKGGTYVRTTNYRIHPQYNAENFNYDAALIFLTSPIQVNNSTTSIIRIAALNSDVSPGTIGTASGWGTTTEDGASSDTLMAVDIPVVSRSQCSQAYGATIELFKICAGYPQGGKDSCQGDSGGPFITGSGSSRVQVGIVSYGYGCAREGIPGVYTRIGEPTVRNFIKTMAGV